MSGEFRIGKRIVFKKWKELSVPQILRANRISFISFVSSNGNTRGLSWHKASCFQRERIR